MTKAVKPIAVDLFCGLGGWSEGLLAEGWDCIGFDIERHVYGEHRYPGQLVIQDVTTLHGLQFRDADLIVASPPCQEYSYMAMPWKIAKAKAAAIRADTTGAELARLNRLFDSCFRIQREACEAAGRHVPMIVENVRGAQPWVGRARWSFGSFFLWGDIPALMPVTSRAQKFNPDGTAHPPGSWFAVADSNDRGARSEGTKVAGLNWSNYGKPGYKGEAFNTHAERRLREDIKNTGGSWFNVAHNTTSGKGQNPDGRILRKDGTPHMHQLDPGENAVKHRGSGAAWFDTGLAGPSKSNGRKMASAMIAKIPLPLSRFIGATFYPRKMEAAE
jgi:C-5 cytosine-specific DNA methylase